MKPSPNCLEIIKSEEGCVLHGYLDSAHVATIGYGCIEYENGDKVKLLDTITQERADELLAWQVDIKAKAVDTLTHDCKLNQNQFDALVDFAYNEGIGALSGSTLLKRIKAGQHKTLDIDLTTDFEVQQRLKEMNLKGVPEILYWFLVYNKITDPHTGKKVFSEDLFHRRFREWKIFNS